MQEPHQTPLHIRIPPAERDEIYIKRRRATELRRAGWDWDSIAAEVGYSGRGAAYNAVKAAMMESRDLAYGEAELYRAESIERLLALLKAVWPMAEKGSEKHVGRAMQLIKQIGDLRGENLPVQVEIGASDVDRLLRDALQEFERRAAELDRDAEGASGS